MTKKKTTWYIVQAISFSVFILIIIIMLMFLFKGNNLYYSSEENNEKIIYLSCEADATINDFFSSQRAREAKNKVIITFENDRAEKFFYNFLGKYDTDEQATNAVAAFRAKYDIYMGQKKRASHLSDNFSNNAREVYIGIYADADAIDKDTALFFFVDNLENVNRTSMGEIKSLYENEGFSCKNED